MPKPQTTGLFVRIPHSAAEKLDRAAFELKTSKQELVTGLLARYVDPGSAGGLEQLRQLTSPPDEGFGFGAGRRVIVETEPDGLTVGRHAFRPVETAEVLSLSAVAELLKVEEQVVEELASEGRIPARRLGGEWRFARRAVLDWLAEGEE